MAESFDFQINDLKFRAATSDRFPYARATAPFRKEQFDAAPTVGDQSLSGWWTRGQLSFHKGAGVKYYEVLDGDEVLNRFDSSEAVECFKTPGEATLDLGLEEWFTLPDLDPAYNETFGPTVNAGTDTLFYIVRNISGVSGSGALYRTSFSTTGAVSHTSTGTPKALVYTGSYVYAGFSNGDIERLPVSGSAGTIYYTHSKSIAGLWYAKGRLWVLDVDGDMFTVALTPSTIPTALSSPTVTFPSVGTNPSLASSPSSVYVAPGGSEAGDFIYRITLEADGSIPVLSAPIVAAEFPGGVGGLHYHLGHILCDADGLRAAQIQSDGSLLYGPAFIDDNNMTGTYHTFQHYVYAASTTHLYAVDMSAGVNDNSPLAFPHRVVAEIPQVPGVYEGSSGVVTTQGRYCAVYRNYKAHRVNVWHAASGWLKTGWHRFGTLEGKHFQSVEVRSRGTGTIKVYVYTPAGSSLVGSMDAASGTATFNLGLTGPEERIALYFVLELGTDVYTPPVLLGYQIKALPSPVRQRLIKWPLMIHDVVRDRYGVSRGTREGAWTAWSELEALEESDALVTFTDHRTGETGAAFIESLELQTDTPTRGAESGFGGVGYITLRKVG